MNPTLTYQVPGKTQTIEVFVGPNLLAKLPALLKEKAPAYRYALITDSNVQKLYGEQLVKELNTAGLPTELFSFPAGESSKNEAIKQKLEHALLKKSYGRDTVILALGGGVVGDLAGFVAATYLRGVPYVQIPTTVLSMVDSSIGGKVGIDTPFGKNLLGAFWQPLVIVADISTLDTLSEKEKTNGWFEALKMFLTLDPEAYEQAKAGFNSTLLERAMELKMQVVEDDERETGLRAILNFGHSVGHAIEQLSNYTVLHGYAVALGMLVEARASVELGHLNEQDWNELAQVLKTIGVQGNDLQNYTFESVWQALQNDKKNRGTNVKFISLKALGSVFRKENEFTHTITEDILKKAWNFAILNNLKVS